MKQELFLDTLLKRFPRPGAPTPATLDPHGCAEMDLARRHHLGNILRNASHFLLNGAVVDDLYTLPREVTDYSSAFHLPQPVIFFELMDPLEITRMAGEEPLPLKGLLFGGAQNASSCVPFTGYSEGLEVTFNLGLFYDCPQTFLPDEMIVDSGAFGQLETTQEHSALTLPGDGKGIVESTGDVASGYARSTSAKLFDLCVNVIAYINAHNATIRRTDRQSVPEWKKINRKRVGKGKKPLEILKPYHWIEIKQHEIRSVSSSNELTLPYRERVRGHFQRYHTSEGTRRNWVDAYVRGPEDAPWKENRYRVLEDMLRRGPKLDD